MALLASSDEWSARALESVLEPAGYRVVRVFTGAEVQERARSAEPDCILLGTPLPDANGVEVCQALRRDPLVMPGLPIIGITPGAVVRNVRLSWLRAGAWDVFASPLDPEELVLKLDSYLREAARTREWLLVDRVTGLYNGRGLRRRARELVAEATRQRTAVACVVFGFDPLPEAPRTTPGAPPPGLPAVKERIGSVLRIHGRLSDAIGWWNGSDFAILAPATDADGAAQLAERLVHAIETAPSPPGALVPALAMRAGYEAVADIHATRVEPEDLLARAAAALQVARTKERGVRIRRFEAS